MSRAKAIDSEYFLQHPGASIYTRSPLPGEWAGVELQEGAQVTVYLINPYCRVRVLVDGSGKRIGVAVIDRNRDADQKRAA